MFRSIGPGEIALIVIALLLLFGATRLPQIGKSLGTSMRAFKRAITGEEEQDPPKPGSDTPVGKSSES